MTKDGIKELIRLDWLHQGVIAAGAQAAFLEIHFPSLQQKSVLGISLRQGKAHIRTCAIRGNYGRQRAGSPHYTVSQIITEYSHLRETLLRRIESPAFQVSPFQMLLLTRIFEAAIGSATEEFVFASKAERDQPTYEALSDGLLRHEEFVRQREAGLSKDFFTIGSNQGELTLINSDRFHSLVEQHAKAIKNWDLAHFFQQAPSPLALTLGPQHTFSLVNRPYIKLVGRDPLGLAVREAFSDEEFGNFADRLDEVYRSGKPFEGKDAPFLKRTLRRRENSGALASD